MAAAAAYRDAADIDPAAASCPAAECGLAARAADGVRLAWAVTPDRGRPVAALRRDAARQARFPDVQRPPQASPLLGASPPTAAAQLPIWLASVPDVEQRAAPASSAVAASARSAVVPRCAA